MTMGSPLSRSWVNFILIPSPKGYDKPNNKQNRPENE